MLEGGKDGELVSGSDGIAEVLMEGRNEGYAEGLHEGSRLGYDVNMLASCLVGGEEGVVLGTFDG